MKTIDVGAVIDEGRWTGYQKLLIAGTALTIILDGVDNQLLGNALPTLMAEWSLPRSAFANVLAVGPFGMMVGGALGGMLGDRIGRRTALLLSVLSFAVLTLAIAAANDMFMLGLLRFLSGVGPGRRDAQRGGAGVGVRAAPAAAVRGHADHRLHSARRHAGGAAGGPGAADLRLARACS